MANFAQTDVNGVQSQIDGANSNPWTTSDAMSQYGNAAQTIYAMYAANQANQQQQSATDQALQLQRYVLAQQQQNQMPYMQTGNAALQRLNMLMTPQGQQMPQLGGDPSSGQMMMVTAPNGQRMMRPTSEMDHWRNLGATIGDAVSRGNTGPGNGMTGVMDPMGMTPQGQSTGPEHHYTKNALKAAAGFFGSQPGKTTDLLRRLFSRDKSKDGPVGTGGGGGGNDGDVGGAGGREAFRAGLGNPAPPGKSTDQLGAEAYQAYLADKTKPSGETFAHWYARIYGTPPSGEVQ